MLLPSEIEAKSLIPAVRAILAKKLIREYSLKEEDVAKDLSTNKAYTPSTLAKFVGLCNYMRYTLIICDVHHSIEPNIDEQICEQCRGTLVREH